ncbi:MAG: CBS domain-containing protein [Deltaproteobacteria bacterium]|nr:CBS domain-containing protein [Deltaproteobacteria bacterium]MBW2359633.1 CBS domain-containing protein [Deltaproteobacteria bacterium]
MTTTARDIMQTSILSLAPTTPLAAVQRMFFEEEIHGAPVVDETGVVLGIVTSMDLVRSGAEQNDDQQSRPAAVEYLAEMLEFSPADSPDVTSRNDGYFGDLVAADVMTENPVSVDIAETVPKIAQALTQNRIHRVLIVDGDRLCGIVSSSDLVELLAKEA